MEKYYYLKRTTTEVEYTIEYGFWYLALKINITFFNYQFLMHWTCLVQLCKWFRQVKNNSISFHVFMKYFDPHGSYRNEWLEFESFSNWCEKLKHNLLNVNSSVLFRVLYKMEVIINVKIVKLKSCTL